MAYRKRKDHFQDKAHSKQVFLLRPDPAVLKKCLLHSGSFSLLEWGSLLFRSGSDAQCLWWSSPIFKMQNWQVALFRSGLTVITTESSRGNINRFPELASLSHSHGSSRNQQLESNRRKDGSQWRYRQLVLSSCQSYR